MAGTNNKPSKFKPGSPIVPGQRVDVALGLRQPERDVYKLLRELERNKAEVGTITLTGVTAGDILIWNGTAWVNSQAYVTTVPGSSARNVIQSTGDFKTLVLKQGVGQTTQPLLESQDSAGSAAQRFTVLFDGTPDCGGAGNLSLRYGASSVAGGLQSTALGRQATTSDFNTTCVGYHATCAAGANSSVAIGSFAFNSADNSLALGDGAFTANSFAFAVGPSAEADGREAIAFGAGAFAGADASLAFGSAAFVNSAHTGSVAFGTDATTTAANQCVMGSPARPLTDFYLGGGVVKAAPGATTVNATGGTGTNIAGAGLRIAGGKGTGNAVGGSLLFATADALGSGAALQSLTDKEIITAAGLHQFWRPSSVQARQTAELDCGYAVATDATRTGRAKFSVLDWNGSREVWRGEADGTNPLIGFLGAAAVVRQTGASAAGIAAITDASAKAAVNALQVALANLGLITSPA